MVSKSSKVNGIREDLEEQNERQNAIVTSMKNTERQRRAVMMNAANDKLSIRSPVSASLQQELESEHYDMDIFVTKLPRWLQQSATMLEDHAAELHSKNENVSKLLIGYHQRLGDSRSQSIANGSVGNTNNSNNMQQ